MRKISSRSSFDMNERNASLSVPMTMVSDINCFMNYSFSLRLLITSYVTQLVYRTEQSY